MPHCLKHEDSIIYLEWLSRVELWVNELKLLICRADLRVGILSAQVKQGEWDRQMALLTHQSGSSEPVFLIGWHLPINFYFKQSILLTKLYWEPTTEYLGIQIWCFSSYHVFFFLSILIRDFFVNFSSVHCHQHQTISSRFHCSLHTRQQITNCRSENKNRAVVANVHMWLLKCKLIKII